MRIGAAERIVAGDVRVHLEEVAVALAQHVDAEPPHGVRQVEVDGSPARPDPAPVSSIALQRARSEVPGHEIAEARVAALEEVVALRFGNVLGRARVARPRRHPEPPVVPQRLGHEGGLGLLLVGRGQAGRVELDEPRVGEGGAAAMRTPDGGGVGRLRIGREVVGVGVAAGGQHHRVGQVRLQRARHAGRARPRPRARPSTTMRSSISRRGSRLTPPAASSLASAP